MTRSQNAAAAAGRPGPDAPGGAAEPVPGVRLGFKDGSELALGPDDPAARALKSVADVLAAKGPEPA